MYTVGGFTMFTSEHGLIRWTVTKMSGWLPPMSYCRKYFKPTSLTWTASSLPLLAGLFIAFEPVHHLAEWSKAVSLVFGEASPYVLINAG
ncbi:MAG: hypothetical protein WBH14_12580, partial [Albidovulum sp.]